MVDLNKVYLCRMTHIENIPHILKYGITHPESKFTNQNYIGIGDQSIIETRKDKVLIDDKKIGDFIPFYFAYRTPMLLVIQTGYNGVEKIHPSNIVYCVTNIGKIIESQKEFIFSDGHPLNTLTTIHSKDEINNLFDIIDENAIKSIQWSGENYLDVKRRKEAELLLLGDLGIDSIVGFVVYDDMAKNKMIDFGVNEKKIAIRKDYYYDKF